jgi:hypothetical protein
VPAVIGNYPDTPGFRYRPYLESLISHGELPLPLLRRAVLGDAPVATAEVRAG